MKGLLMGSVSGKCAGHSYCPVVVVHKDVAAQALLRHVVVGIDGSDASVQAVRFALDEARVRNESVVLVNAWSIPTVAAHPGIFVGAVYEPEPYREASQKILDDVVAQIPADERRGLDISTRSVEGRAAEVLCDAARGADMLVM